MRFHSSRTEEAHPTQLRMAWVEDGAPQKNSSPAEPCQMIVVDPLQTDASWLHMSREEEEVVKSIQILASNLGQPGRQDVRCKITFLYKIMELCISTAFFGSSRRLIDFCRRYSLVERIQVLLEDEPWYQLSTELRQVAMLAIEMLSKTVEVVLEEKKRSLLETCFRTVFWLPPHSHLNRHQKLLLKNTLRSMDSMLRAIVLSSPVSKIGEELQNILQVLLDFTNSEIEEVWSRALGRIQMLSRFLCHYSSQKDWNFFIRKDCTVCYEDIQVSILGQLLGRLLLLQTSSREKKTVLRTLHYLSEFICRSRLKKNTRLHREGDTTSLLRCVNLRNTKPFERYLTPSERTHIILAAVEVMTETTAFDKTVAEHILEVAMGDPDFWLMDVQKIVSCIYDSLQDIQKLATRHCFDTLLMKMADKYPEEVVTALLNIAPQGDSTALQLWGQIFYKPQIQEKILMVFVDLLRFLWMTNIPSSAAEGTCIPDSAPPSREFPSEDLGDKPDTESNQRYSRLVTASLLVGVLHVLSETRDMARKMQVLLPDMMGVLQVGSADLKIKSLMFFKNVMDTPTTIQNPEETVDSPITGQLMENLLLLFDSECSQLRELSISIFRDQLESVVGSTKRRNSYIRSVLIPLLFRMSDQSPGVAKASGEALLAAAKLLKWKELKHLLETQQTRRIGKCLLLKDKSRAEEYLHQSLPYLKDPQATVREVAVRFIGLAARLLQSVEKLDEICSALQPLQRDSDPSVSSLAVRMTCNLRSRKVQRKQRFVLRALCCWCLGPGG
ncbi:maestro heat-like repeat family member 5 [Passer domesticus]|uniref:maestro heat-like repeat family member 5 n=1 Tax=Passer domesticus TaxID=48849 RepID=UPI0030FF21E7